MLTVPFEKLFNYFTLLCVQYFHYRKLERATAVGVEHDFEGVIVSRYDEFALSQTPTSTLFRAARLEKARMCMDDVSAEEEVRVFMMNKFSARNKPAPDESSRPPPRMIDLDAVLERLHLHTQKKTESVEAVTFRVGASRGAAEVLTQEMESLLSAADQEDFLMRQFIVNSFTAFQFSIVSKYFLRAYNLKRTWWVKLQEKASFVLLPVYTLGMIWFVYVFNLSIGSRATNLWLAVTFIGENST
jgi:hypothetical protein